jgi:hypothetical protein
MGKTFHPECFSCAYCGKLFANSPFYLEDGLPYCEEGKINFLLSEYGLPYCEEGKQTSFYLKDGLPYCKEGRQLPSMWRMDSPALGW